jgi:hypothetical protein
MATKCDVLIHNRRVQNKYENKLVKVKIINFPTSFFKKDVHCFPLILDFICTNVGNLSVPFVNTKFED